VIIDTAPLLAVADTRMLANLADGLVLVVRADATSRQVAFSVLRRVSEDGTRILGTILNAWNPRNASNTEYSEQYEFLNKEQAG
jgi:protein-tyrosine kinase